MEPNNFEDDIRKKLQEREIAPNEGAWAQLDAQLAAANTYKKSTFPWLAVAAGFVGIAIIASVWFSQTNDNANSEMVIENTTKPEPIQTPESVPQEVTPQENAVSTSTEQTEIAVEKAPVRQYTAPVKISEEPRSLPNTKESVITEETAVAVADHPKSAKETVQTLKEVIPPQTIESQAVAQVVAQVKELQDREGVVSPESVDLLLSKARQQLQTQKMLSSEKIDPAALLLDVEQDLEQSFRDKVFDALGSGFEKIRTAVVERNN